jgi:hypothetical protein
VPKSQPNYILVGPCQKRDHNFGPCQKREHNFGPCLVWVVAKILAYGYTIFVAQFF